MWQLIHTVVIRIFFCWLLLTWTRRILGQFINISGDLEQCESRWDSCCQGLDSGKLGSYCEWFWGQQWKCCWVIAFVFWLRQPWWRSRYCCCCCLSVCLLRLASVVTLGASAGVQSRSEGLHLSELPTAAVPGVQIWYYGPFLAIVWNLYDWSTRN